MEGRKSRQDIEGLRAIGALMVAAYHIWFGGISGGVDVFFVVSGYFLGSGFVRRSAQQERLSIAQEYGRFLNRVVPQVLLALLGILLIGFVAVSPANWIRNLRSIAASALYVENWWLIQIGQNYLERTNTLDLTQHFWAVSIIGQAYFVWPLVTRAAAIFARVSRVPELKAVFALVLVLTVASSVWSVTATYVDPRAAYFDFFTRFWQFGAGALVALLPGVADWVPPRAAALLSWLALALILSTGPAIGSRADFPGYASLWPVLGAVLLILTGRGDRPGNAGWLLASSGLAGLGAFSLGLYLWHWPLYVVAAEATGGTPSVLLGTAIIAAAIAIGGAASSIAGHLRERAARIPRPFGGGPVWVMALVAVAVLAGGSERLLRMSGHIWENRLPGRIAVSLDPGPFSAIYDRPEERSPQCFQSVKSSEVVACEFGNTRSPRTMVAVGGSHSFQWLSALRWFARERGWKLVTMTKNACIFADPDSDPALFEPHDRSCAAWNKAAMAAILRLRPGFVFTIGTRPDFGPGRLRFADFHGETFPLGFVTAFQTLAEGGIAVVALRDNPWMGFDVPACVFSPWRKGPEACRVPRQAVLDDQAFRAQMSRLPAGVAMIDLSAAFCGPIHCDVTRDGIIIYRDSNHVTMKYVNKLREVFASKVQRALVAARTSLPE